MITVESTDPLVHFQIEKRSSVLLITFEHPELSSASVISSVKFVH